MRTKLENLVKTAGRQILSGGGSAVTEKEGIGNYVTELDQQLQEQLRAELSALVPEAGFQGEEGGKTQTSGLRWIVDPIDGTTNFVRDLHQSAVSVALAKDGKVEYAVVLDPFKRELFTAQRGMGAFLNGRPIRVSDRPLEKGIFGMGTAIYRREYLEPTMRLTTELFKRSCDFRRMGAAALDLCYVAAGRYDLFFEYNLCPWDHAAGSLIITEAGGQVTTMEGEPLALDRRCSVWASNQVNSHIRQELG